MVIPNFNLTDCFEKLHHCDITKKLYPNIPRMIRIRYKNKFTILIFNNGKIRVMGNCNEWTIEELNNIISSLLYRPINLVHISDTVVFSMLTNVNLYNFSKLNSNCKLLHEAELFPAISLLEWRPTFVNLFYTGKVIVLGKNAKSLVNIIHDWILTHI